MKLLWVDDDGPERFVYEKGTLEDLGWTVAWAFDVGQAAECLRRDIFDLVIVDQNLADAGAGTPRNWLIWGACRILYWLRSTPDSVPRPWLAPGQTELWTATPAVDANRNVHVLLVSAFHDQEVLDAARRASEADWKLKLLSKPVNTDELVRFIQELPKHR